jgi:hypothetical protein
MNPPIAYAFARMAAQGDLRPVHAGLRQLNRGQWIICRSNFGLELAEILSESQPHSEFNELNFVNNRSDDSVAHWVRDATNQDLWLWNRLQDINHHAISICQEYLDSQGIHDTLLDIATSIDGKSIVFEFLGEPSETTNGLLTQLTEIYQSIVKDSPTFQQIEQGCGPGCGTSASCGSSSSDPTTGGKSSCGSCSIASRCKKR